MTLRDYLRQRISPLDPLPSTLCMFDVITHINEDFIKLQTEPANNTQKTEKLTTFRTALSDTQAFKRKGKHSH